MTPTDPVPCRNCGSTDLYSQEVPANGHYGPKLLPLGFLSEATFEVRVCGDCGLVEWHVPRKHLPRMKACFMSLAPDADTREQARFPDSEVAGTPWQDNPDHTTT